MDKKAEKKRIKRAFSVVKEVVDEWDPYSLLKGGSPPDEFDSESHSIVEHINRIASEDDLIQVISQIFTDAFEPKDFELENCRAVGTKMYRCLKDEGLLG